jgi:hypothetical protein
MPLVIELSPCAFNLQVRSNRSNLSAIEGVPTRLSLHKNGSEVGVDRGPRSGVCLKPKELGVMAIACGLASKDRTSQKRFTPQGNQALRIQIFRVDGPDAHASSGA